MKIIKYFEYLSRESALGQYIPCGYCYTMPCMQKINDSTSPACSIIEKKDPEPSGSGSEQTRTYNTQLKHYCSIGIATPGAIMPLGSTAFLMILAIAK